MNKNYETPSIEIIDFEFTVQTAPSVVIEFPWDDGDSEYFE